MKNVLFAATATVLALAAVPASAADRVKTGVLVCNAGASIGMIISSKQELACTYTPSDNSPVQRYSGVIKSVGLDLGVTGGGVMTWGVLALTKQVAPGALAGPYGGVSGDVALGVGVGANVLVGSDKSYALNPVSVEGNVGASLALGVSSLELRYVP
ncbi:MULTISPECIES: DUF992 domain-containing protein [unclassified Ancylobacter]|jgi:hypothetical protein|uniref:DUF992 domain-containing protein n=1 Tax=unclassified Ancylobacter TaxID=2626613 RepID=UPI00226FF66E|nr:MULTISPECIES: DUF992 domain-containing protein [unclassified Ancylobacter]WAC25856.1 DUF992 domain-containing protein [Ancylobacter sp. SL191]WGD31777.1 DUF992 domain-containing protein [Ancylobacter sp. WKF20]